MGNSERRSVVASVLGDASYRLLFVIGFSYWCLFFLFGWKPSQAIMGFDLDALWIFFMGGITAASAILAVIFELKFPNATVRSSLSLISSVTVSLAFGALQITGGTIPAVTVLCSFAMGVCFAVLGTMLGLVLTRVQVMPSAFVIAFAFVCASLVALALYRLDSVLVSCLAFFALAAVCAWGMYSEENGEANVSLQAESSLRGIANEPVLGLVLTLSMGLTYGILRAFTVSQPDGAAWTAEANMSAFFIAGILMLITSLALKGDNFLDRTVTCSIALAIAGFVLSVVSDTRNTDFLLLSYVGHAYNAILMYIVAAALATNALKVPGHTAIPLVALAMNSGQLFGALAVSQAGVGSERAAYIVTTLVLLVFLTSFVAIHLYNIRSAPRFAQEAERIRFDNACEAIVLEAALTPRERDVFYLLALGRSNKQVERALVLSPDTVKTHVRHVYGKLDIHSREELVELVEEKAGLDRAGGAGRAGDSGR